MSAKKAGKRVSRSVAAKKKTTAAAGKKRLPQSRAGLSTEEARREVEARVRAASPEILQAMIDRALDGSWQHAKFLLEYLSLDSKGLAAQAEREEREAQDAELEAKLREICAAGAPPARGHLQSKQTARSG